MISANPALSPDELVCLRDARVSFEYYWAWHLTYPTPSVKEIIHLRREGVTTDFASVAALPNRKVVSIETIIRLARFGVTPQELRLLRE